MKIVSYILIILIVLGLSILLVTQVIGLIRDIKKKRLKAKNKELDKKEEE